jgi:GTP pyrophosphokinase
MDASTATARPAQSGDGHAAPPKGASGALRRQNFSPRDEAPEPAAPDAPTPDPDTAPEPLITFLHPILQLPFVEKIAEQLRKQEGPGHSVETVRSAYAAAYSSPTVEALIARLRRYLPDADGALIRRAYALATIAHSGQYRQSGEPYIDHPVSVATILLELRLDADSLAAALLHDVVEDSGVSLEVISTFFGAPIAHVVDGVTKLSGLENKSKEELQAGTYRKLIIAAAEDPRVLVIKLADRLHNMRTLGGTPPAKQKRVARETLDIYAPLAHRLGMWQLKSELEDLAFRAIQPERYREIAAALAGRKDVRERAIGEVVRKLRAGLEKEGIRAQVVERGRHIYSIWRKAERKGVPLEQICDQLALRVIVQESNPDQAKSSCYRVLGLVHGTWTPVLSEFDDYIAVPKESSYQSLHTTVIIPGGQHCEVQIRTEIMHNIAENGIITYWQAETSDEKYAWTFESKLHWLRELIEWRMEAEDGSTFVEGLQPELDEQVFVLTPMGKVITMPVDSTPVDFAYRIHSEIGNTYLAAKVNGIEALPDTRLENGDVVEIVTSNQAQGPRPFWLNFVRTASAKNHIRRFLRRKDRREIVFEGRQELLTELERLQMEVVPEEILTTVKLASLDDLYALIGSGEITARYVALCVLLSQVEGQADAERPAKATIVTIQVIANDRVGLWRDISTTIANAGGNIVTLQQRQTLDGQVELTLTINLVRVEHLFLLLDQIARSPGVVQARRTSCR